METTEIEELRQIVEDLASEIDAPLDPYTGLCVICSGLGDPNGSPSGHDPKCSYRRAVEFVDRQDRRAEALRLKGAA